jgi:hypothetical protein
LLCRSVHAQSHCAKRLGARRSPQSSC